MQNLANNIQFGGVKEYYMGPLNTVLERNCEKLNDFLLELTNVYDLSERLRV
jgi:Ras GTPase-activating-like protein IQGAP2/3